MGEIDERDIIWEIKSDSVVFPGGEIKMFTYYPFQGVLAVMMVNENNFSQSPQFYSQQKFSKEGPWTSGSCLGICEKPKSSAPGPTCCI